MKYTIAFLFFIGGTTAIFGQTAKEIIAKINDQLTAAKPLHFETSYKLYKNIKSQTVHESYTGVFQKNSQNEIYMKIGDTEFINLKNCSIKLNPNEKAMVISNPQAFSLGTFDFNKLLTLCSIPSCKDYKTYWEIHLIPNKFSGLNYEKIVLQVNKNYTIKKQQFYFNSGYDFSKDYTKQEISNPRLEIDYSNYNNNPVKTPKFNSGLFFTIAKNNKIIPTAGYKGYEISDQREIKLNNNKRTN